MSTPRTKSSLAVKAEDALNSGFPFLPGPVPRLCYPGFPPTVLLLGSNRPLPSMQPVILGKEPRKSFTIEHLALRIPSE
jgi:hypothetical protein